MENNPEIWPEDDGQGAYVVQRPPTWAKKLRMFLQSEWNQESVPEPQVDPELPNLSAIERSAEVFRYTAHKTEYWISPRGFIREWFRFNLRIAVILGIPSFFVVPIITYALTQFTTWTNLLATTVTNMIVFPIMALIVIGLISTLVFLARALNRRQGQRRDPYY